MVLEDHEKQAVFMYMEMTSALTSTELGNESIGATIQTAISTPDLYVACPYDALSEVPYRYSNYALKSVPTLGLLYKIFCPLFYKRTFEPFHQIL